MSATELLFSAFPRARCRKPEMPEIKIGLHAYPGFSGWAMADRLLIHRCGAGNISLRAFSGTQPTGLREVNKASGFRFRIGPAR